MKGTKARFEGRQTLVKGVEINITTQEFNQFEEYVDYTRSLDKAKKAIEEQRGCDKDNNIVISVTELVQEKPKTVAFNVSKLLEYGTMFYTEDDAINALTDKPDYTIVKADVWFIKGYIWYFDYTEVEYKTKLVAIDRPNKAKAHDIKAILGFEIEREYASSNDVDIIATHDVTQTKDNVWFVINSDQLNRYCLKED